MNQTSTTPDQDRCECGMAFGGHKHQVQDYPVGSHVRVTVTIGNSPPWVQQGTVGRISGHCDDGRAICVFGQSTHTFHYPSQCIQVMTESEVALHKSEQAIVELSKQLVEFQLLIKAAHKQLCLAADHNESMFVDSARAMLGDALNW